MLLVSAAIPAIVGAGAYAARDPLAVGVGHKAKTLCSGVFVSKRDPAAVLAELQADDLAALRYIRASIDTQAGVVTATAGGLLTRRAVYRQGLGCTLALDGLDPPPSPPGAAAPGAAPGSLPSAAAAADLPAAIARAFAEPNPSALKRTKAVVVVHRDHVVGERYADGISADTPLPGWSMTKSVLSALIGVLVRNGRLAVGDPAPVPEWQQPGDPRAAITVEHLLRMSSGLRFDEGMASPRSDVMRMLFGVGDAAKYAAGTDVAVAPGTAWQYSSATTNILSRVARTVLGDDAAYLTFPRRALFGPLGMSSAVLETDAAGTFIASSYMHATARDWARFGLLYLHDGVWNGTRILPEGWVRYTTTPAPADPAGRYGAHFWLQVPDDYSGSDARLPVPAFHAAGHEGQFVTIVPSRAAVIVRLGRTRHPEAWDHAAFVREILAALPPEQDVP
jgi:CubicO group peptidase (beta-lactamase class C family)